MQQHDALEIQARMFRAPSEARHRGGLGLADVLVLLVPAVKAGNGKIDFDKANSGPQ